MRDGGEGRELRREWWRWWGDGGGERKREKRSIATWSWDRGMRATFSLDRRIHFILEISLQWNSPKFERPLLGVRLENPDGGNCTWIRHEMNMALSYIFFFNFAPPFPTSHFFISYVPEKLLHRFRNKILLWEFINAFIILRINKFKLTEIFLITIQNL